MYALQFVFKKYITTKQRMCCLPLFSRKLMRYQSWFYGQQISDEDADRRPAKQNIKYIYIITDVL